MDDHDLPAIGPSVDLTKMAPLNQRRSVTFMNHFTTHTASFLNKFSNMAEEKLAQQSLDMQRLEIALNILEAKLASIPGLDDIKPAELPNAQQPEAAAQVPPASAPETINEQEVQQNLPEDASFVKVRDDIRYKKYLKMVNVGVPKVAVANKMIAEGLDPDLLDTPDAPVPDGGAVEQEESDNESQSQSSGDDFSD